MLSTDPAASPPEGSATMTHHSFRCSSRTRCGTDKLSSSPNHLPFWRRQHLLTRPNSTVLHQGFTINWDFDVD